MKKQYLCIGVASFCLLMGCGGVSESSAEPSASVSGPEAVVSAFYQAEYDYRQTTEPNGTLELEGTVYSTPFREHFKVVAGESLFSEAYYEESTLGVKATLSTKDGWVEQMHPERSYPYGYGEDLQFTLDRTERIGDRDVEVYTTSYTKDIAKIYRIKEESTAEIKQEYFIDIEKQELIRMVTDLAEYNYKLGIATVSVNQGISLAEAEETAGASDNVAREVLEIYNYGHATEFEIPLVGQKTGQ